MSRDKYITRIGGDDCGFPRTQWTLINNASDNTRAVEEYILKFYWKPLYFYLIRKGIDNEMAKDYTQGFLCEILYGREFLGKADSTKGKFRSFLLTSFSNYVKNAHRKNKRHKEKFVAPPKYDIPEHLPNDPADAFDYAWAVGVLEKAIEDVKTQCLNNGLKLHWDIFADKVLGPMLSSQPKLSMASICEKYGIESEAVASNMLVTVKRRFQKTLIAFLKADNPTADEKEVYQNFAEIFSRN